MRIQSPPVESPAWATIEAAHALVLAAVAIFLLSFGLFAFTTSKPRGYELETVAVSEGLVRTGHFEIVRDSPLSSAAVSGFGHTGKDGRLYGRSTPVQPVLEAPFMAAGLLLDELASEGKKSEFRFLLAQFYNPLLAALTAVALFFIVVLTRRSVQWAAAISLLFAFASIGWPYAKIGMETTSMFLLAVTLLSALITIRSPRASMWLLTGMLGALTAASKPVMVFAVLPFGVLLWDPFWRLDKRDRLRTLGLLGLPFLVGAASVGWFNAARHGSLLDFGSDERLSPTLAAPFNWPGLLVSPGKGLVFYSPLVLLGALGLLEMWRRNRSLTLAIMGSLVGLVFVVGVSSHWSEETWGPRYLVPAAWLLLIPIAWWVRSRFRARILVVVASLGVAVQVVGVVLPYSTYQYGVRELTGVPLFEQRRGGHIPDTAQEVPYGRDPTRWVPQVSPLLFQTELALSATSERLGGPALTMTYAPFEGRRQVVHLRDATDRFNLLFPDFWWAGGRPTPYKIGALAALVLLSSGLVLLWRAVAPTRRGQTARPQPADPPADS